MSFSLTSPEARTHDRVAAYDDDPTPRGTVAAVLRAALDSWQHAPFDGDGCPPLRVLDLGAGYGCWSSELRKLAAEQGWPVHITAIEINPKREPDLRKWCDDVYIGDWREFVHPMECDDCEPPERGPGGNWEYPGWTCDRCAVVSRGFDLIIGNPPFGELLRERGEFPLHDDKSLAPERTMVPMLLELAPAAIMLHTQQAFVKSGMGRAVQRHSLTSAAWQVPGAVSFREDGKQDSKCYEVSLWLRGHTGPCSRYLLDDLPSSERKWTTPPGSESPEWAREHGYPLAPGFEA